MAPPISNFRGPGRNYPPLVIASLAMIAMLALLPSALDLPQQNPSETLEYAPVPPESNDPTPPLGNLSSVGLGRSAGVGTSSPASEATQVGGGGEAGSGKAIKSASTKRCVGSPPRQTEDPLSPPCVASFEGDNGGSTYQGVSGDDVRILLALQGGYNDVGSRGVITRPIGQCFDVQKPSGYSPQSEPYHFEIARLWQRYFTDRYQLYGRSAHFFLCFSSGSSTEEQRARAVENYRAIKPFGVVVHEPNGAAYADVMASKGVLVFGLLQQHRASFFQKHPKLTWSYLPSIEQSVEQFTDWACTKVIGHPVSFGGNDSDPDSRLHNGQPRRIGIIRVDRKYPAPSDFADLATPRLQECGAEIVATVINPTIGTAPSATAAYDTNVAALKEAGVTTVVWLQGFDLEHSKRAARINYFPEWVLAGDRNHEDLAIAKQQDRKAWSHAWIWTNIPLFTGQAEEHCFMAAREAEPNLDIRDSALPCRLYDDLRQVFTGIQVAGPRLHPDTVDKGFHAIPGNRSSSPRTPACFYLPGDYTCVKDGIAMWWDSEATSRYSSAPGCYRVAAAAARFRVGDWPPGDVLNQKDPARDPCNGWSAGFWFDPAPGPDSRPPQ